MKTIKIDNTTTHVYENSSPGPLNASIKAAMKNVDFGLGVATSTKLLIDIDGTRYRQVVGNVWTKDNE